MLLSDLTEYLATHDDTRAAETVADERSGAAAAASVPPRREPEVEMPSGAVAETGSGLGQAPIGVQPLRGIRRATARAVTQAWSTIPHVTAMDEIDATALLDAHRQLSQRAREAGHKLTMTPLLVAAVARGLRRFPLMNASLDTDAEQLLVHERCSIGIAVATDAGLIVPVVTDADQRDLLSLGSEIERLTAAARAGRIAPEDLRGGTATVTNYGAIGGRYAVPIIRAPEAAIIGFGAIRSRPCVVDDRVEARSTLPIVVSADHRLVDGDLLTAFQEHIAGLLREPIGLLLGS